MISAKGQVRSLEWMLSFHQRFIVTVSGGKMTSILDQSVFSIAESRNAVSALVNGYTHRCLVYTKAMVFSSSIQGNRGLC